MDFQRSLPEALLAKILYLTAEVAKSDGQLGGGYYEICHSHPGLSETRARVQKNLARFICARDGDVLILLNGVLKRTDQATPADILNQADGFLAEFRETKDAL